MTHREIELQVDAYVDGELAAADARELESHLRVCPDCARLHDSRVALGNAIRAQIPAWDAPPGLETKIRKALKAAGGNPGARRVRPVVGLRWLALAASLAIVAMGSWRLASNRATGHAIEDQLLAGHVRSLMPGHLTDVVSSDQHTVKPWFNGRLDFSPPVYDFTERGFPLIGGRLDYVAGRPVAALVYGRRKHLINVFLWPAEQGSKGGPAETSRQGYFMLHWTTSDYVYWVASDLGRAELRQFAALLRVADSAALRTVVPSAESTSR